MRRLLGVLLAILALAPLPASAQRLPTTVLPDHYDLAFVVDLAPQPLRRDRNDSGAYDRTDDTRGAPRPRDRLSRGHDRHRRRRPARHGDAGRGQSDGDIDRSQADCARDDRDPHSLHRHPQRQAARLLSEQGPQPLVRRHATRGDGRAARVPELRRAGLQGDIRRHADDRSRRHGHLERKAPLRQAGTVGRAAYADVRDHAAHVHVSRGDGGRRFPMSRSRRRRRADPHLRHARQEGARTHRVGVRAADPALLQSLLRHQIPLRQARRRRRPGFRRRRDGKHGRDLLSRGRSAGGLEVGIHRHAQDHRFRPRARNGSPVVWRSGDDAVVGRPVAERRICHVDGEQAARSGASRLERSGRRERRDAARVRRRFPGRDPPDSLRCQHARRDRRGVRPDRLRERRRRAADGGALRRRGYVQERHQRVPAGARLQERHVGGFLEGDLRHIRQAGRAHPADVRESTGRAAARGGGAVLQRRQDRNARDVHAKPVFARRQDRGRALADSRVCDRAGRIRIVSTADRTATDTAGRQRLRLVVLRECGRARLLPHGLHAGDAARDGAARRRHAHGARAVVAHQRRVGAGARRPSQRGRLPDAGDGVRPRTGERDRDRDRRSPSLRSGIPDQAGARPSSKRSSGRSCVRRSTSSASHQRRRTATIGAHCERP